MVESLRASFFEELPDFGRYLGYNGEVIERHWTSRVAEGKGETSNPDVDWTKHGTSGEHIKTGIVTVRRRPASSALSE